MGAIRARMRASKNLRARYAPGRRIASHCRREVVKLFVHGATGCAFVDGMTDAMSLRRLSPTRRSATFLVALPLFSALLATSAITARPTMDTEVDHIIASGTAAMVAPNGAGGVAVVARI